MCLTACRNDVAVRLARTLLTTRDTPELAPVTGARPRRTLWLGTNK